MAVKIIIKRNLKEVKKEEAFTLINRFRRDAMNQPGYISGETLVNHYNPRIIVVISTWQTIEDWIRWQESDQRQAYEDQLDAMLEEPTKFEIYDIGSVPEKQ